MNSVVLIIVAKEKKGERKWKKKKEKFHYIRASKVGRRKIETIFNGLWRNVYVLPAYVSTHHQVYAYESATYHARRPFLVRTLA